MGANVGTIRYILLVTLIRAEGTFFEHQNKFSTFEKDFEISGLKGNTWHKFIKGVEYDAFLVKRRK